MLAAFPLLSEVTTPVDRWMAWAFGCAAASVGLPLSAARHSRKSLRTGILAAAVLGVSLMSSIRGEGTDPWGFGLGAVVVIAASIPAGAAWLPIASLASFVALTVVGQRPPTNPAPLYFLGLGLALTLLRVRPFYAGIFQVLRVSSYLLVFAGWSGFLVGVDRPLEGGRVPPTGSAPVPPIEPQRAAGFEKPTGVEVELREAFEQDPKRTPITDATVRLARSVLSKGGDGDAAKYAALILVSSGETLPAVKEAWLSPPTPTVWRRRAALVLAERGDRSVRGILRSWLVSIEFSSSNIDPLAGRLISALGDIGDNVDVGLLSTALTSTHKPELRIRLANALATTDSKFARAGLVTLLSEATDLSDAEVDATLDALIRLQAKVEAVGGVAKALRRDHPSERAFDLALAGDFYQHIGGPTRKEELSRLRRLSNSGVVVDFAVPGSTHSGRFRILCRIQQSPGGEVFFSSPTDISGKNNWLPKSRPELLHPRITLVVPSGAGLSWIDVEEADWIRRGVTSMTVYATQGTELDMCAVLSL